MCSTIKLRRHILQCLHLQLLEEFESVHQSNAAFQLAVCYRIGLGAPEDTGNVTLWLKLAGKTFDELQTEVDLIRMRDTENELQYKNDDFAMLAADGSFSEEFNYNQDRSEAHETEVSLSRELEKMQQVLRPGDYVIHRLQRELSREFKRQGYYNQARSVLWDALQFMENNREYGPKHSSTLNVAADILDILRLEGEHQKGIELGQRQLSICQEVFGDRSLRTASSQIGLARMLDLKERYRSSETLYRQGLETRSQILGKRHPTTLSTMLSICSTLRSLSRNEEAYDIIVEVVEGGVEMLGAEHPFVLTSMGMLASMFLRSDLLWQAEKLFRMQATGIKEHWGDDYSELPMIMNNLAMAIMAQGRYHEAEQIIREAITKAGCLFGHDHHDTLSTRSNLASILSEQERYVEAEVILRELVPTQEAQLGEFHSHTLISKTRLALAVRGQGRLEEARLLLSDILKSSETSNTTSQDHSCHLLKIRIHLGRTLRLMGADEAASQEILSLLKGQASTLTEDHSDAFAILISLSCLLQEDGFLPEAEGYHTALVSECEATLGESHMETLTAVYWLATHWMQAGRFSEANDLLQRVHTGIIEARGEDDWCTQRADLLLRHWREHVEAKQREVEEDSASDI